MIIFLKLNRRVRCVVIRTRSRSNRPSTATAPEVRPFGSAPTDRLPVSPRGVWGSILEKEELRDPPGHVQGVRTGDHCEAEPGDGVLWDVPRVSKTQAFHEGNRMSPWNPVYCHRCGDYRFDIPTSAHPPGMCGECRRESHREAVERSRRLSRVTDHPRGKPPDPQ